MSIRDLSLHHSFTVCGTRLDFVSDDTVAYRCGNAIIFLAVKSNDQSILSFGEGDALDCFAVNWYRQIVVCGIHGKTTQLRVFNFPDKEKVLTLEGGAMLEFGHVAISRDGKRLLSVSKLPDLKLAYWDLEKGIKLVETQLPRAISFVSFNPRTSAEFCVGSSTSLTVWRVESKFENYTLSSIEYVVDSSQEFPREILCHAWSSDGRVFTGTQVGELLVSDPPTAVAAQNLNAASPGAANQNGAAAGAVVTVDGLGAVGGTSSNSSSSTSSGPRRLKPAIPDAPPLDCPIYCIMVTKKYVIVTAENGYIYWLSDRSFDVVYAKDIGTKGVYAASFSPSYNSFVVADLSGNIHHAVLVGDHFDDDEKKNDSLVRLKLVETLPLAVNMFTQVPVKYGMDVSPGSSHMCTFGNDGSLSIWDYQSSQLLGTHYFQYPISVVSCNPDDTVVSVGFHSGAVGLVDARQPAKIRVIFIDLYHEGPVIALRFNREGTVLASIGADNRLFLYRTRDFAVLGHKQFPSALQCVEWVAVSGAEKPVYSDIGVAATAIRSDPLHDNRMFALTIDHKLKRFDVYPSLKVVFKAEYEGHHKTGSTLSVSPNGRLVASGGSDGYIIVRRTDNLLVTTKLVAHDYAAGGVNAVQFSADSRFLVSAGADGGVFSWDLNLESNRRDAKAPVPTKQIIPSTTLNDLPPKEELEANALSFLQKLQGEHAAANSIQFQEQRDNLDRQIKDLSRRFHELLSNNDRVPSLEKMDRKEFVIDVAEQQKLIAKGDEEAQEVRDKARFANLGKQLIYGRIKEQCWDSMEVKGMALCAFRSGGEVPNFPIRKYTAAESARIKKIELLRRLEKLEQQWERNQAANNIQQPQQTRPIDVNDITRNVDYIVNVNEGGVKRVEEEKHEDVHDVDHHDDHGKGGGGPDDATGVGGGGTDDGSHGGSGGMGGGGGSGSGADGTPEHISLGSKALLYHPIECYTNHRKVIQAVLLQLKIDELKRAFNNKFQEFFEQKHREMEKLEDRANSILEVQEELKVDEPPYRPKLSTPELPETVLVVKDEEVQAEKVLSKEEREEFDKVEKERLERLRRQAENDTSERALTEMMGGTLEAKKDISLFAEDLVREEWMDVLSLDEMNEEQRQLMLEFQKKEKTYQVERENRRKLLETALKKLKSDVSEICRSFDDKLQALFDERLEVQRNIYIQELMIAKLMNGLLEEEEKEKKAKLFVKRLDDLKTRKNKSAQALADFRRRVEAQQKKVETLQLEDRGMDKNFRKEFADAEDHVDYLYRLYKNRKSRNRAPVDANSGQPVGKNSSQAIGGGATGGATTSGAAGLDVRGSAVAAPNTLSLIARMTAKQGGSSLAVPRRTAAQGGTRRSTLNRKNRSSLENKRSSLTSDGETEKAEQSMEEETRDPFFEQEKRDEEAAAVAGGTVDINLDLSDKPEDLAADIWLRLQKKRKEKVEKEIEVKQNIVLLDEMRKHLVYLDATDLAIQNAIRETHYEKAQFKEQRDALAWNTEVIFQVLQGQVEIEESPVVTDLKDCEMIHRSIVEDLDRKIVDLGTDKVGQLKEIKNLRKAINMLKWQKQSLELEYQDYVDRKNEFQLLRVTKDLQELIKMGGSDRRQASEISKLDRKIDYLRQVTEEKMQERKIALGKVTRKVREYQDENDRLDLTVRELQAAVQERIQIHQIRRKEEVEAEVQGLDTNTTTKKRMGSIVNRRKLIDLAKAQAEEIEFLTAELERCRKRTFPSFQQMIPPLNPDEILQPRPF